MTDTPPADVRDFRIVIKAQMRREFTVKARNRLDAENQAWNEIGEECERLDCCDLEMGDVEVTAYEKVVLPPRLGAKPNDD